MAGSNWWTGKAAEPKEAPVVAEVPVVVEEPKAEEPVVAEAIIAPAPPPIEVFTPDGVVLSDGSVCYAVFCNAGFSTSGVYWSTVVPRGTSEEGYRAVQAERDEARRKLAELSGSPV